MKILIHTIAILALIFGCGYISTIEYEDMILEQTIATMQANHVIIDLDNDGNHDDCCMCGYCMDN